MIGILPGTVNQIRIINIACIAKLTSRANCCSVPPAAINAFLGEIKQLSNPFSCTGKAGGAEGTGGCGVEGVGEAGSVFVGEGTLCCSIPKFPCWGD